MLHIFKDLLIIGKPLEIGGSESDTSRSTLAISQPSTSGTVKGLPHASTSSSASDLPCSSPSSSSDQEQSSLEEFNTSKDSGTYSQLFFRETWAQFFLRVDTIQALVIATYLPHFSCPCHPALLWLRPRSLLPLSNGGFDLHDSAVRCAHSGSPRNEISRVRLLLCLKCTLMTSCHFRPPQLPFRD